MPSSKFTDNNLKVLYSNLLNHHKHLSQNNYSIHQIYEEMYKAVQYELESPQGTLYNLFPNEKVRAYQAFNAIFYALPAYANLPRAEQQSFKPKRPAYTNVIIYTPPAYYERNYNDTLLTWMILSSMTHDCHHGGYYPSSSGNYHGHHSTDRNNKSNEDAAQALAALLLIVILAAAAVAAFVALYYMLSQFADSVERLWFNEGWLKAALMLATSVGFGAATSALSLTVGAPLLIALAVTAGFSPIGVVIVATACLTVVGAGLATLLTSLIYDAASKSANKDSMDPSDASRFRLTESEELKLINKGIDPIKVKCAIVALRAEIAKVSGGEDDVPSYFSRHFFGGESKKATQPLLDQVRALRSGNLDNVKVGDLTFDCKVPVYQTFQQPNGFYAAVPSAAPYDAYSAYVQQQLPQGYPPYVYPTAPGYHEVVQPPAYGQHGLYPQVPSQQPAYY